MKEKASKRMATKLNVGNCKEADEFGVEDDGVIVPK